MPAFGAKALVENYSAELQKDKSLAADAQNFLDQKTEVIGQINDLIVVNQGKIDHVGEVIGKNCLLVIDNIKPTSIEEVQQKNSCTLNTNAVKDTRNLLKSLYYEKSNLTGYIKVDQFGNPSKIDQINDVDKSIIADAKSANPLADLFDDNREKIVATKIINNEVVDQYLPRDTYDEGTLIGYGLGTLIFTTVAMFNYLGVKEQTRKVHPPVDLSADLSPNN